MFGHSFQHLLNNPIFIYRGAFSSLSDEPSTTQFNQPGPALNGAIHVVLVELQGRALFVGFDWTGPETNVPSSALIGSLERPNSVACVFYGGYASIFHKSVNLCKALCSLAPPVFLTMQITRSSVTFTVDGHPIQSATFQSFRLQPGARLAISTTTSGQCGATVSTSYCMTSIEEAVLAVASMRSHISELTTEAAPGPSVQPPQVIPADSPSTDPEWIPDSCSSVEKMSPICFRCKCQESTTIHSTNPVHAAAMTTPWITVRFSQPSSGAATKHKQSTSFMGVGIMREEAVKARSGEPIGQRQNSVGCLINGSTLQVLGNGTTLFHKEVSPLPEHIVHLRLDGVDGLQIAIDGYRVDPGLFTKQQILTGSWYLSVSLGGLGNVAEFLPNRVTRPLLIATGSTLRVEPGGSLKCITSQTACVSTEDAWSGCESDMFAMRITNACREPIGIGLVSARLWNNSSTNVVGGKAFGPHSIGLVLKDRRVHVHFQDELIQWKPIGRMPPLPKNVDLMMRVRDGKVSFFYQGIPVNLPAISDLTLPADERFRVAYTMSDEGQTAVIPPNLPVGAPGNVKQRCSLLGDVAHVELAEDSRVAKALCAGALCFSSEAFAITPCAWDAYSQGCSGCERTATPEVSLRGTLWLCSKCTDSKAFALCDNCYWNENTPRHAHDRNTFIPLLGTGASGMCFVVEDAKDSYLEVGVTLAGCQDGLGAIGTNATTVLLGKVSDLVKAAMPAEKIAAACLALKNGDEICLRVDGAKMTVLVKGETISDTTLSLEDDPLMKQPLRFGVRMGCTDQRIRVTPPLPPSANRKEMNEERPQLKGGQL